MDGLIPFQALIKGFVVRKKFLEVRKEYEQVVRDIEGPTSEVIWPNCVSLGTPCVSSVKPTKKKQNSILDLNEHPAKLEASSGASVRGKFTTELPTDASTQTAGRTSSQLSPRFDDDIQPGRTTEDDVVLSAADHQCQEVEVLPDSRPSSTASFLKVISDTVAETHELHSTLAGGEEIAISQSNLAENPVSSLTMCKDDATFAEGLDTSHAHDKRLEDTDLKLWAEQLPSDETSLRAIHSDVAMELLWIEQAVASRMQYLAIKAKMEASPS